jgi:hypothetical protein
MVGVRLDCMPCGNAVSTRYRFWEGSVMAEPAPHGVRGGQPRLVAFTDFYIYLVSSGTIRELNTWQ